MPAEVNDLKRDERNIHFGPKAIEGPFAFSFSLGFMFEFFFLFVHSLFILNTVSLVTNDVGRRSLGQLKSS